MIPLFKVRMNENQELVNKTLQSGYIGQGSMVDDFERRLQEQLGSDVTPVTVNSCTSALDLSLQLIGVGPGDFVISTPQTCFASNSVILNRGANIIWADIDPITGLISPESVASIVEKLSDKVLAIMAVNWAGRACDYEKLKLHGIPIIEDAAHSWPVNGENVNHGDYVCYSFQAIKFLTSGDGGCLIPPKEKENDARLLRWYGLDRTKGESFRCTQNIKKVGFKYHMNDINASIGISNLDLAKDSVKKHKKNAKHLWDGLRDINFIKTPNYDINCSYWLFTIILDQINKDEFSKYLNDNGIANSPVHFRNDKYDCTTQCLNQSLKGVDEFTNSQINIPVGWWLSNDEIEYIINTIKNYK